jgi:hypothetical protein
MDIKSEILPETHVLVRAFISASVEEANGVSLQSFLCQPRWCVLRPDLKPY